MAAPKKTRTTRTTKKRPEKPKWRAKFLACLAQDCCVGHAAKAAKVGRRTAYDHRARDAEFAEAWDAAIEEGLDACELEVRRRAIAGTERPVFFRGTECGRVREYSDILLIFYLKAHRPEKYRDNYRSEEKPDLTVAELVAEAEERAQARKAERE